MSIFKNVAALLKAQESFVMATILGRSGSAPRDVGSRMIIRADGSIIGSIGGGILEATGQRLARELSTSRKTLVRTFTLSREDAASGGMICGGDLEVLLHYEDASRADRLALYEELQDCLDSRKRAWLVVKVPPVEVSEGPPAMCVLRDGSVALAVEGMPRLRELLFEVSATQPEMREYEGTRLFIEPLSSEGTVYIFGAGHVGQKVAHLTRFVGFRTVVLDDREEFAKRELLASADEIIVLRSFEEAMKELRIDGDSYLVIVTRGHAHDKTVLEQALRSRAGYIGMIGSRKKRDATYEALAQEGFGDEDFARVHSPIGLKIDAETPEEIAVSIVAELIQARARRER